LKPDTTLAISIRWKGGEFDRVPLISSKSPRSDSRWQTTKRMRSDLGFNTEVVITRGFSDEPHLDLLDESHWRLEVNLDEEAGLDTTHLAAFTFGGWVTIFQPPWFSDGDRSPRWEILQARRNEEGEEVSRAKKSVSVAEILEIVPPRFHPWVVETTEEALEALEEVDPESDPPDLDQGLDGSAAALAELSKLKSELAIARDRQQHLRRRRERFYGDLFLYEFAPETDLYWRIDDSRETDWLLVRDASENDDRFARALIPPDESMAWRWAAASHPDAGGEYLDPAEALAKAPKEFRGWVVAKTYEALQRVRFALFDLARRSLTDADDLVRIARLATHAQQLSGLSQGSIGYPGAAPVDEEDVVAATSGQDGRAVLLFSRTWGHILEGHPEMEEHLEAVMEVAEDPEHREPDQLIGRERFFRRVGPEAWMRVVIEIAGPIDRVVTAFPQGNPPERWRSS